MKKKLGIPLILALVLAMIFSGQAFAAGPNHSTDSEIESRLIRVGGVVVSVNVGESTLVIKPHRGPQLTLTIDAKTRFEGAASSLEEIEPGMQAWIVGQREQGGMIRLVRIVTRLPLERFRGEVLSVDLGAGTLTIETFTGDTLTFRTDENTRYKGYRVTVESLEDIQPGMLAGIMAQRTEDGLLARGVLLATVEDLPRIAVRMAGRVVGVTEDSFTIENRGGEEINFLVDENTRFRSRTGHITSINQLKEEMLVLVGGTELEDGGFLAKFVLVVERKP